MNPLQSFLPTIHKLLFFGMNASAAGPISPQAGHVKVPLFNVDKV